MLEDNELEGIILAEHLDARDVPWEMVASDADLLMRLRGTGPAGFAAVLIPCDLRGDDELDLLRSIRQRHPDLPIFGTFYDNDPDTIARCNDAGMARHLLKPYVPARIAEMLRQLAGCPLAPPSEKTSSI